MRDLSFLVAARDGIVDEALQADAGIGRAVLFLLLAALCRANGGAGGGGIAFPERLGSAGTLSTLEEKVVKVMFAEIEFVLYTGAQVEKSRGSENFSS